MQTEEKKARAAFSPQIESRTISIVGIVLHILFFLALWQLPAILNHPQFPLFQRYDFSGLRAFWPMVMPFIIAHNGLAIAGSVGRLLHPRKDGFAVALNLTIQALQLILLGVLLLGKTLNHAGITMNGMRVLIPDRIKLLVFLIFLAFFVMEVFTEMRYLYKYARYTAGEKST